MFGFNCKICGGPLYSPTSEEIESIGWTKSDYEWLEKVRLYERVGIWEYNLYGNYTKGEIETEYEYDDDHPAIHDECWKLNKKSFSGVSDEDPPKNSEMDQYHCQFFEFEELVKDKRLWKIENPSKNEKNKNRILKLIEDPKKKTKVAKKESSKREKDSMEGKYEALTLKQLKEEAKSRGLSGYSNKKKCDLVTMIEENDSDKLKKVSLAYIKKLCEYNGVTGYEHLKKK